MLKKDGGRLTIDNVRLAHRLCNRADYGRSVGRSIDKDLARVKAARERALQQSDD